MVVYAEDGLGQVQTFSLPESSKVRNWGKSAACQSVAPREKVPKTECMTDVTSSEKRKANDDQSVVKGGSTGKCLMPRKHIRTSLDTVPETLPHGSPASEKIEVDMVSHSPMASSNGIEHDEMPSAQCMPQVNVIAAMPFTTPQKLPHSATAPNSMLTINLLLLHVGSKHTLSPIPELTRPAAASNSL